MLRVLEQLVRERQRAEQPETTLLKIKAHLQNTKEEQRTTLPDKLVQEIRGYQYPKVSDSHALVILVYRCVRETSHQGAR